MSSNPPATTLSTQHSGLNSKTSGPLLKRREGAEGPAHPNSNALSVAQRPAPAAKSWAHFVAGACGGAASAIATAPLDVLKTRLQSDFYQAQLAAARTSRGLPPLHHLSLSRSAFLHVAETFQILFAVRKIEGSRAYFKGLGPSLVGVVPARAIHFFAYGNSKRFIARKFNDGKEDWWVHMLSAANAGIVTGTATCPVWVVKTRLQLDKNRAEKVGGGESARRYKNALDCTMQTFRQEGIGGLYRGLGASYLGVTETTVQWVLYERMKGALKTREEHIEASGRQRTAFDQTVHWTGNLCAAGVAKFVAALFTYPHEVVRTRLRQAPLESGQLKYTGIVQCLRLTYKEEGMAALYGGLVPHMLRVVPSAAIMFGAYEGILKLLGTDSGV